MDFTTLLVLAIGLSMDAFAVSLCKGLSLQRLRMCDVLKAGLWFGGFQALMPVIGYFLGVQFESVITSVDHWIAFVLLVLIGGNMIREARGEEQCNSNMDVKTMFLLAVATSIDALAIGITFAFLKVSIWTSALTIGLTTFCFSAVGVKIGNKFGLKYKTGAEIFGGVILILIGLKVLLEHLGVI